VVNDITKKGAAYRVQHLSKGTSGIISELPSHEAGFGKTGYTSLTRAGKHEVQSKKHASLSRYLTVPNLTPRTSFKRSSKKV
jgi:hypothetical protein